MTLGKTVDIIPVLDGGDVSVSAFTGDGVHINSDFLNGLNKEDALNKMYDYLEENNIGSRYTNYNICLSVHQIKHFLNKKSAGYRL